MKLITAETNNLTYCSPHSVPQPDSCKVSCGVCFSASFRQEIVVSKSAKLRGVFSADAPTQSRLLQPLFRVEEHK